VSWSRRFEEPIELPDGRKLKTLAEAMAWLAKEIPKSEHKMEKVQNAAHFVTRAAEHNGPMIFAQMGMLQAIHRRRQRVFNPDRKDPGRLFVLVPALTRPAGIKLTGRVLLWRIVIALSLSHRPFVWR